jgi:hypothetical protein
MFFIPAEWLSASIFEGVKQMGDDPTGTHACG